MPWPGIAGNLAAEATLIYDADFPLFEWLSSDDEGLSSFASGYACIRIRDEKWPWLHRAWAANWPADLVLQLVDWLPACPETENSLGALNPAFIEKYWQHKSMFYGTHTVEDAVWIVGRLLKAGRAPKAVEKLSDFTCSAGNKLVLPLQVHLESLRKLRDWYQNDGDGAPAADFCQGMRSYSIRNVFAPLQSYPALNEQDEDDLIWLEYFFHPVFEIHGSGDAAVSLKAVQRMATQPKFFAELLIGMEQACGSQTEEAATVSYKIRRNMKEFISYFTQPPGTDPETGVLDMEVFKKWIEDVGSHLNSPKARQFLDEHIGYLMAHTPVDADGNWPGLFICELLTGSRHESRRDGLVSELVKRHGELGPERVSGGMNEVCKTHAAAGLLRIQVSRLEALYPDVAACISRACTILTWEPRGRREEDA